MSGVQSVEARAAELLKLRDKIDAELARLDKEYKPNKKRSRHEIPECGTESAYQRHRWFKETPDEACKSAHAEYERLAAARRRMRKLVAA